MMLLTAFILLIGFVALAGMVARVGQLADETGQESRRAAVLEADTVLDGAQEAMQRIAELVPPGDATASQHHLDALNGAMAHFDALQSARGFLFHADAAGCSDDGTGLPTGVTAPADGNDAVFWVEVRVVRADMSLQATLSHEVDDVDVGVTLVCP